MTVDPDKNTGIKRKEKSSSVAPKRKKFPVFIIEENGVQLPQTSQKVEDSENNSNARSSLDASLDESSPNLTIHTSYEINLQPRIENELLKKIIAYDLSKWTQNNQTLTPGSQNNSIMEGKIIFPLTAKITYK